MSSLSIGIPTSDYFMFPRPSAMSFMNGVAEVLSRKIVDTIEIYNVASPQTSRNRDELFSMAIQKGSDFHMQIDADMSFSWEAIARLIETARERNAAGELVIVTGVGHVGHPPFHPALFRLDEEQKNLVSVGLTMHDLPATPFEVDTFGSFGFLCPRDSMLIIKEKFEKTASPFTHILKKKSDGNGLEIRHDFAFCLRAKECGVRLLCDPRAKFDHARMAPINWGSWVDNRDNPEREKLVHDRAIQQFN